MLRSKHRLISLLTFSVRVGNKICSNERIFNRFFFPSYVARIIKLPVSKEKLKRGVICASAGNHAQGVALSAAKVGCRAVIVMPTSTPGIKIDAVRQRGGEVILHGDSYDEGLCACVGLEKSESPGLAAPFR